MTELPQFKPQKRYILSGRKLNAIMAAIRERTPIAGDNMTARAMPQGVVLTVGADADAVTGDPFEVTLALSEDGSNIIITVQPGTLNGTMTKIGVVDLDAETTPTLTASAAGTHKVYLEITSALTFTDGYLVANATPTGEVKFATTIPVNDEVGAVWNVHIATIIDGEVTAQLVSHSLWANICDAGTGAGQLEVVEAG